MSEQTTDGIITCGIADGPVTIIFPNLFEPKPVKDRRGKPKGDPKYSATFLFDPEHPDLKALKRKAVAIVRAKHPGEALDNFRFPFVDGDEELKKAEKKGKDGSFYEGKVVFRARSNYAPGVIDGRQTPPKQTLDQKLIYSGCKVAFEVNLVYYDAVEEGSKPGITAYLNSVCFVSDGPRIAAKDHAATFADIAGKRSDVDPTDDEDELSI